MELHHRQLPSQTDADACQATWLPKHLNRKFAAAQMVEEQSRLALLSFVQQQRTRQHTPTCLGSLPDTIVSVIVEMADFHHVPAVHGPVVSMLHTTADCYSMMSICCIAYTIVEQAAISSEPRVICCQSSGNHCHSTGSLLPSRLATAS